MFVLILEAEDYEFLVDPRELWKSPVVHVRRGVRQAQVWLSDEVTLRRAGGFSERDTGRIVRVVEEYQEDLLDAWFSLREDAKRGRLRGRHTLIE